MRAIARNPLSLKTVLRGDFRNRVGIPLDRRLHPATSSMPAGVNINLTRRCNLKCAMCIQYRQDPESAPGLTWYESERELPLSQWIRLLDELKSFRPTLTVTGGEPTLYAEFAEFIRAARERRLFVQLLTNGTTLKKHAQMLVELGVEIVIVSLDGPPDIHDTVRGVDGAFRKTEEGVRALVQARKRAGRPMPFVGVNCTISKANIDGLEEMVPLVDGMEADFLQYQHTIFNSRENVDRHNRIFSADFTAEHGIDITVPSIPDGEFYESEIDADDVKKIAEAIARAKSSGAGRPAVKTLPGDLPLDGMDPYYNDLNYRFHNRCNSLWKSIRILPDGTVSPCLQVIAGNITDNSLEEIWNGRSMRGLRKLIKKGLLPGCVRCCKRQYR